MPATLRSILTLKCPRCNKGNLFEGNAYHPKYIINMPNECKECHQPFFLEPGFYYGAMYVSYGVSVGFGMFFLVIIWFILGFNIDNLLPAAFGMTFFLLLLFPYNLRISRAIWLAMFYKEKPIFYDDERPIHHENPNSPQ